MKTVTPKFKLGQKVYIKASSEPSWRDDWQHPRILLYVIGIEFERSENLRIQYWLSENWPEDVGFDGTLEEDIEDALTPFEHLVEYLKEEYPFASVSVDDPLRHDGTWFIEFIYSEKKLAIEWNAITRFGLTDLNDGDIGFGERPAFAFDNIEGIQKHIKDFING